MTSHPHLSDDAATGDLDAMVRECIPLVHHHVRGLLSRLPAHVDRDELVSAGMYALATCAGKYDASVGTSFGQFASSRIRGALLDELRAMDWASRSARKRARDAASSAAQLGQTLGRTASAAEVAADLGISTRELSMIEAEGRRGELVSLQVLTSTDQDAGLPVVNNAPDADLLLREQTAELQQAVEALSPRLRAVVEQYFFAQRKMNDIAVELGVTESRVSQLRSQALTQLRGLLADTASEQPATAANESAPVEPQRARTLVAVGGTLVNRIAPTARPTTPRAVPPRHATPCPAGAALAAR